MALQPSRSYLALCQDMCADLGITGGTMATTVTQNLSSQEQIRVANWIARADLLIQQEWADWDFLYFTDTITVAAGTNQVIPNYAFNTLDQKSLVWSPAETTTNPSFPRFMDWRAFQAQFLDRLLTTQASPTFWSRDPLKNIWLAQNVLAASTFQLSYWKTPVRMSGDSATSPIPADFDTVIVERAKMLYGQRENAPEILSGSSGEYTNLMDKLKSAYLPNWNANRLARNDSTTLPDAWVD
jgi:hypothetical protein